MKNIIKLWKNRDFYSVYTCLKNLNYKYTLENIERDFKKIDSADKYCYLIYLLSKEFTVHNTILICDFLTYTDTFFYDIHSVIRMFMKQAFNVFPLEKELIEWVVVNYDNHPDSPFSEDEMRIFKETINTNT